MLASRALLLFVILVGSEACDAYRRNLPSWDTPLRVQRAGTKVYDKSGIEASDEMWQVRFDNIELARNTLKDCLGLKDEALSKELFLVPIVILPSAPIPGKSQDKAAFIHWDSGPLAKFFTPPVMFVRDDYFYPYMLRHEWIHRYVFLSGEDFQGDPDHKSTLFTKCEHIKTNND